MDWQAKWIWLDDKDCVNQYADFRTSFYLDDINEKTLLYISADSSYQVWVNGDLLEGNQFSDWPKFKTYNEFDISHKIIKGENVLSVKVHHIGFDFSTYAKGKPGLFFEIRSGGLVAAVSNENCFCRCCRAYADGHTSMVSPQLGYNFMYDAGKEDMWYLPGYECKGWNKAVEISDAENGFWEKLSPRPIKMLTYKEPLDAQLISKGRLMRVSSNDNIGRLMMQDFLSPEVMTRGEKGAIQNLHYSRPVIAEKNDTVIELSSDDPAQGAYAIFDLGEESVGLLSFDIEAAEGTILDISHGEHLDDLRIRSFIDGRTFADRYICREGRQKWHYPFRRLGGRYLEIHIPELKGKVKIYNFTLVPVEYPFDDQGYFCSVDDILNKIWKVAKKTLSLCAHDHYEDCPWREQALYAADSRLQALFGYYAFGEYDMPVSCWELIRNGYRRDGLLELVSPGKVGISIPGFSLQWIIAVYELFLFSGKKKVIEDNYTVISEILLNSIERLTDSGVVGNSTSPEHWNFYEWTPGFEGIEKGEYSGQNGRLDAAYNLYLIEALRNSIEMGEIIGGKNIDVFKRAYQQIAGAFNSIFWNNEKRLYASFSDNGILSHYSQLVQALAIREKIVPEQHKMELCESIKHSSGLTQSELSSKLIIYESLLEASPENINYVLNDIKNVFGGMCENGATSLWEAAQGADAFEGAGSLCHGWSSVFNYLAGACLLGIKPLKPGFAEFLVRPLESYLSSVNGIVKTPAGEIEISCTKTQEEIIIKLRHPKSLIPIFDLPPKAKITVIKV